jgi:hypothetical protein
LPSTARRRLEDLYGSLFDDQQFVTGISFAENNNALIKAQATDAICDESHFLIRKIGEERQPAKRVDWMGLTRVHG